MRQRAGQGQGNINIQQFAKAQTWQVRREDDWQQPGWWNQYNWADRQPSMKGLVGGGVSSGPDAQSQKKALKNFSNITPGSNVSCKYFLKRADSRG